jgi:hypothetical protein
MAFDKDELIEKCLKAIKEEDITFFDEISLFVGASVKTLYNYDLHELQDIKDAIETNRVNAKKGMRKNWKDSEAAPVLQIAAYKLIATDEELDKLTISKVNAKVQQVAPTLVESETDPKDEPIKD